MNIDPRNQKISLKVVYYGPGLSGKTTNLEIIHEKTPEINRGKLTTIATDQDRTLFFDFIPLDIGEIGTSKIETRVFTVPGQAYYNSTRKIVLRGVDGIVFVADSQKDKMQDNLDSLDNLRENLAGIGLQLEKIPLVMQYNKRDLPNIESIETMNKILNPRNVPAISAVAVTGEGVFSCLRLAINETISSVEKRLKQLNSARPNRQKPVENKEQPKIQKIETSVQRKPEKRTERRVEAEIETRLDIAKPKKLSPNVIRRDLPGTKKLTPNVMKRELPNKETQRFPMKKRAAQETKPLIKMKHTPKQSAFAVSQKKNNAISVFSSPATKSTEKRQMPIRSHETKNYKADSLFPTKDGKPSLAFDNQEVKIPKALLGRYLQENPRSDAKKPVEKCDNIGQKKSLKSQIQALNQYNKLFGDR